jgi:hypothetical protein
MLCLPATLFHVTLDVSLHMGSIAFLSPTVIAWLLSH